MKTDRRIEIQGVSLFEASTKNKIIHTKSKPYPTKIKILQKAEENPSKQENIGLPRIFTLPVELSPVKGVRPENILTVTEAIKFAKTRTSVKKIHQQKIMTAIYFGHLPAYTDPQLPKINRARNFYILRKDFEDWIKNGCPSRNTPIPNTKQNLQKANAK